MMKKMIMTAISLFTVFSLTIAASANGSITEDSVVMTVDEMICSEYSLDFVEAYYNKVYTSNENNGIFEYNLSPANSVVSTYIQERNILSGVPYSITPVKNYRGIFSVYEVETSGEYVHIMVKCDHSFAYEGSKIGSGSGNPFYLTFVENENDDWTLICFHSGDILDDSNIGWALTFEDYLKVFEPINEQLISAVKQDQERCAESLNQVRNKDTAGTAKTSEPDFSYKTKLQETSSSETKISNAISPLSTIYSGTLDDQEMMWYALENCSLETPASGGYDVPYNATLFASKGGDCTNFISHCFLAGGARPVYAATSGHQNVGWYYRSDSDRSYSWSSVNYLYNFLTGSPAVGPRGTGHLLTDSFTEYDWGDLIQINYIDSIQSTDWNHSTIITGFRNGEPYVTSRSSKTKYTYHQLLYTAYPIEDCKAYRVIVVDETYRYTLS